MENQETPSNALSLPRVSFGKENLQGSNPASSTKQTTFVTKYHKTLSYSGT
jgi:hypothetical protein